MSLLICCHLDVKKNRQIRAEQQNLTKASEIWIYDSLAQEYWEPGHPFGAGYGGTGQELSLSDPIQIPHTTSGPTPRGDVSHPQALQSPPFP